MRFAENWHSGSAGQERQFVAAAARAGLRCLVKYCKDPEEEIVLGRWAGLVEPGAGEQRSQSRMSISWQDFARSEGAEVDSLRQLPLLLVS